jgi:hypothetical protein
MFAGVRLLADLHTNVTVAVYRRSQIGQNSFEV